MQQDIPTQAQSVSAMINVWLHFCGRCKVVQQDQHYVYCFHLGEYGMQIYHFRLSSGEEIVLIMVHTSVLEYDENFFTILMLLAQRLKAFKLLHILFPCSRNVSQWLLCSITPFTCILCHLEDYRTEDDCPSYLYFEFIASNRFLDSFLLCLVYSAVISSFFLLFFFCFAATD